MGYFNLYGNCTINTNKHISMFRVLRPVLLFGVSHQTDGWLAARNELRIYALWVRTWTTTCPKISTQMCCPPSYDGDSLYLPSILYYHSLPSYRHFRRYVSGAPALCYSYGISMWIDVFESCSALALSGSATSLNYLFIRFNQLPSSHFKLIYFQKKLC